MTPAATPFEAFFLPVEGAKPGQRFCLFHPAQGGEVRGSVLYVHPFAEEMNKSRRMAALLSRALAKAGFNVLQIDLLGCGDSSGDFGDASWAGWIEDIVTACQWLRKYKHGAFPNAKNPPLWLWGLRSGCLLTVQAAAKLDEPCNFLFWAPTPSGKTHLQQFLRIKAAADLAAGGAKAVMDRLRADLSQGLPIEVGGYLLGATLANDLEQATLAPPSLVKGLATSRMEWFDLSTREGASLTPVATKTLDSWKESGFGAVRSHHVQGPSFWQTTEIEDAPALVTATTAALQEAVA